MRHSSKSKILFKNITIPMLINLKREYQVTYITTWKQLIFLYSLNLNTILKFIMPTVFCTTSKDALHIPKGIPLCHVNLIPMTEHLKNLCSFKGCFMSICCDAILFLLWTSPNVTFTLLPKAASYLLEQLWKQCVNGFVVHYVFVTFCYKE